MTVCLAWRNSKGVVHLASDSRITLNGQYSDFGLKIFSVPVKVYFPTSQGSIDAEIAFEKSYGLTFSGSFLGVQLLREYLFNVLQKLQCVPGYIDISFVAICNIVNRFFCFLLQRVHQDLNDEIAIDFFITGYCPKKKTYEIAKFEVNYNSEYTSFTPSFRILPSTTFFDCIGAGGESFLSSGKLLHDRDMLKSFCSAIRGSKIVSVGGNPQYGTFDKVGNFQTRGVASIDAGKTKASFNIGGIDMGDSKFGPKNDELFFMGSYVDPFSE